MKQCYLCERLHDYPRLIVDAHHKLRRLYGGTEEKQNLMDLCRDCHRVFELLCNEDFPYSENYYSDTGPVRRMTTVIVKGETHHALEKIGVYGESMDCIIRKCIEAYKKVHKL